MADERKQDKEKTRVILPTGAVPIRYELDITPTLDKFTFKGTVSIELDITQDGLSKLEMNSAELTYSSVKVTQGDQTEEGIAAVLDKDLERVQFSLKKPLKIGKAFIHIAYAGELNDKMKGFYRSKYKKKDGTDGWAGTTQFEASDARRAFPCWDEPAVKAIFAVTLTVPEHMNCVSNMPETKVTNGEGTKTISFGDSPKMSTYLLAWVVGEFEYVEGKTKRGVVFRVYTPIGKKKMGSFALDIGVRCLDFYEGYFDIPYPLPKCDMLAIPDFAAGAMENWGCITYREVAILCDENSSAAAKQYVAIVVCHELAHQWFGNLVTMEWWDQLWLNEGFACFMEYLSADALCPNWNMWGAFLSSEFNRALELDALVSSHPIEVKVYTPAEVDEIFDAISYCKGASVIRMLENYIGSKDFQKGLITYLNSFKYANAVTEDLWSHLAKASGKPVAELMDTWTKKMGYPVLQVERQGKDLKLTQSRFLSSGIPTKEQDDVVWPIPVVAATKGNNEAMSVLMKTKELTLKAPEGDWVKFNPNNNGFYIVQYMDKGSREQLAKAVASGEMDTSDRLSIIRDAGALAKSGRASSVDILELALSYVDETDFSVWVSVLESAGRMGIILREQEETYDKFKAYMRKLLSKIGKTLGWEKKDDDSHSTAKLRGMVIGALCAYEEKEYVDEAMERFQKHMKTQDGCSDDLLNAIFKTAVRNGGVDCWNQLREFYEKCEQPMPKNKALRNLANPKDLKVGKMALDYIMTDKVRSQDIVFPLRNLGANPYTKLIAWEFTQENWDVLFKKFDGGFHMAHVAKVPSNFITRERADQVEKFFSGVESASCKRAMQQCVEAIRTNASWFERDFKGIEAYFNQ